MKLSVISFQSKPERGMLHTTKARKSDNGNLRSDN